MRLTSFLHATPVPGEMGEQHSAAGHSPPGHTTASASMAAGRTRQQRRTNPRRGALMARVIIVSCEGGLRCCVSVRDRPRRGTLLALPKTLARKQRVENALEKRSTTVHGLGFFRFPDRILLPPCWH